VLLQVGIELVFVHQVLLGLEVDDDPYCDHDGAAPEVCFREFYSEEAHRDHQVQEQVEDHVGCDVLAYLAAALVHLEVHEDEIVFVHQVLDVEEQGGKEGDQWHQTAKQEAVEEDDQGVTLMVAEIKLVVILEGRLVDGVLVPVVVVAPLDEDYGAMDQVDEPEAV